MNVRLIDWLIDHKNPDDTFSPDENDQNPTAPDHVSQVETTIYG